MKNKAFTLIELLAVIVVLGIIMLIAVTSISGIINNSRKDAFKKDAQMILKNVDYNDYINNGESITNINKDNLESKIGVPSNNYESVELSIVNGKPYIVVVGNNKWNNLVAYGNYDDIKVVSAAEYEEIKGQLVYDSAKGVNKPQLVNGMTPIKWDNNNNLVETIESDPDWYDYTSKKWANAKTADGSMWVWIPRYIYIISSGWHSATTGTIEVQFSKGTNDNWNSALIGNIDTDSTANASNNKWTNHPAFNFGGTELMGIWVAKFEATAAEGVSTTTTTCNAADNVSTKTIKVLPNAPAWRCVNVGNAFTASRNMETNAVYGWGTTGSGIDTHLIKNVEWGAVVYLSKSTVYGRGSTEIWNNPSNNFTTGCAGSSVASSQTTGCTNAYNTTNGLQASATGTIYGIYDMSGGVWDYVSAYVNNGDSSLSTYASVILAANAKYKDVYTKGTTDDETSNYALTINKKGDAVYEISNGSPTWFNDYSYMPNTNFPWFYRGGGYSLGAYDGELTFDYYNGDIYYNVGFRPVLLVKTGL